MASATHLREQGTTRIVPAGEFKAKCLQLMDEVNEKDLTLIITKRGKPVMRASAATEEKPFRSVIGRSPNVRILGDIMKPVLDWGDPGEKWRRANAAKPRKKKSR